MSLKAIEENKEKRNFTKDSKDFKDLLATKIQTRARARSAAKDIEEIKKIHNETNEDILTSKENILTPKVNIYDKILNSLEQYKTASTFRRLSPEELDHINGVLGTNFKQVSSELIYKRVEKEKENAGIRRAKIAAKNFKGLEERFQKLTTEIVQKPKKGKIQQLKSSDLIVTSPPIYDKGVIIGIKK